MSSFRARRHHCILSVWGDEEEDDVDISAGLLELIHEFGFTVDLDGFDLEVAPLIG